MTTRGWGTDARTVGLLGVGDIAIHNTPTILAGTADFLIVRSAGNNGLGIATDGTLYAWGYNFYGQLGNGTTDSAAHSTPAQVSGLANIVKVDLGGGFGESYALDNAGNLYGWGNNNYGQLGLGNTTAQTTPTIIATGVVDFASGASHLIILQTGGVVQTAGDNRAGALATTLNSGTFTPVTTFQTVTPSGASPVIAVAAGDEYTVVLRADGTVLGVGDAHNGTIGNASSATINNSWLTVNFSPAVAIWTSVFTTFAQYNDGTVWGLGGNNAGILGTGSTSPGTTNTPLQMLIPGGVTPTQFINGWNTGIGGFRASDGTIYTWGNGRLGGMGDGGTTVNNPTPSSVNGLTGQNWIGGGCLNVWAGDASPTPTARARSFVTIIG